MTERRVRACSGFTYLGMLLAIALLSVGLLAASELWVTTAKRQREAQLTWVGEQYRRAISSYRQSSPNGVPTDPKTLGELVEDTRYPMVRRHLRALYPNPLTGQVDWELIRSIDGGIRGVRVLQAESAKTWDFVADGTP